MPLPSAEHLPTLRPERWRELGVRLASIGLDGACVSQILQDDNQFFRLAQPPLRTWRLRRRADPAGFAMRMLMFGDAVTRQEACLALGNSLLEDLIRVGFVTPRPDGALISPFQLHVEGQIYAISDVLVFLSDSVYGLGAGTRLLCQAAPTGPGGRVLDLGCGAGMLALVLAAGATQCVGTDINPRAVHMARINAAINGIGNADFRQGDLFAPVTEEKFDLIVSHPPFVAMPNGVAPVTFLYGGLRGDEFAMRILNQIRPLLTSSGRAVLLAQWPEMDSDPLEVRVRNVVGPADLNVLVLRYAAVDPGDACTLYAAAGDPTLGGVFASMATMYRTHLDHLGIQRLQTAFVVIEHTRLRKPWTVGIEMQENTLGPTGARIEKILAAQNFAALDRDALLDATLRLPAGSVFSEERALADLSVSTIFLRLPPDALVGPIYLTESAWALALTLHSASTVRDGIAQYASARQISFDSAAEEMLPAIREALLSGIFELQ